MLQSLPGSIVLDTTPAWLCPELLGSHLCAAALRLHGLSLLLLAHSRMLLSTPTAAGASMGWELRWHLAEAQAVSTAQRDAAVDLYLLQGEIHGLASVVQRRVWKGYVCKQISYSSSFLSVLQQMLPEESLGNTMHAVL